MRAAASKTRGAPGPPAAQPPPLSASVSAPVARHTEGPPVEVTQLVPAPQVLAAGPHIGVQVLELPDARHVSPGWQSMAQAQLWPAARSPVPAHVAPTAT